MSAERIWCAKFNCPVFNNLGDESGDPVSRHDQRDPDVECHPALESMARALGRD